MIGFRSVSQRIAAETSGLAGPAGRFGLALVLALAAWGASGSARAQGSGSVTYRVTFQGAWTTASTPDGVPGGAHFSTLIGAVHNSSVSFWSPGGTASSGIESMAEVGGTSSLQSEINAARPNAAAVILKGIAFGGTAQATVDVPVSSSHPLITLVTMIAPSPDWFVGVSGLSLLDSQGRWLSRRQVDLFPYDAGTEDGTKFSLSNPATTPQGTITSIKGQGKFSDRPMATLTFDLRTTPNGPPTFSGPSAFQVRENTTSVGTVTAADSDAGDEVERYALAAGADRSKFTLDSASGALSFKSAPDHENPTDGTSSDPVNAAGNNQYVVVVAATSGTGGRARTASRTIVVTVTDVPEAPAPPKNLVASSSGQRRIDLSWEEPVDTDGSPITGYRIEYSTDDGRSWADLVGNTGEAVTTHSDTLLAAGTRRSYRVSAITALGTGSPSNVASATPLPDADVNGDGRIDEDDALAMYYAYALGDLLGDGTGGTGVERFRQVLLSGRAGPAGAGDAALRQMLNLANLWKETGDGAGGDVNGDGGIDEDDALAMYYAYALEDLLGDGTRGSGIERFRQVLLGGRAGPAGSGDAALREMLRKANELRAALS